MPNVYKELGEAAVRFFQPNDLGWITGHPGGGVILGVRGEEAARPLVATRCLLEGRNSVHSQMRLWTKNSESLENLVGICAFILFGDYDALFDELGQPVFLEGVEEAKAIFEPHYRNIPEFLEIEAATRKSQKEMENLMRREIDDDNEGEEWKNQG
mgnify:CR=1 FL=1